MKTSTHITVAALRTSAPDQASPAPQAEPPSRLVFTPGSISEIRCKNLNDLFERFKLEVWRLWPSEPERGMIRKFSNRLSLAERYVSNMLAARKGIGSAISRKIEVALSLESGWMDREHAPEIQTAQSAEGKALEALKSDLVPGELQFIEMASELYRNNPQEAQAALMELLLKKVRSKTVA